jgi:hypothetical protein
MSITGPKQYAHKKKKSILCYPENHISSFGLKMHNAKKVIKTAFTQLSLDP